MKKVLKIWVGTAVLMALVSFFFNTRNHPLAVEGLVHSPWLGAFLVTGMSALLQAVFLRRRSRILEGLALGWIFFKILAWILEDRLPSHDQGIIFFLSWIGVALVLLLIQCGWDEWEGLRERFLPPSRLRPQIPLGIFFLVVCAFGIALATGPVEGQGQSPPILAVLCFAWASASVLRSLGKDKKAFILRGLLLFMGTWMLYQRMPYNIHLKNTDLTPVLVGAQFVLAAFVFLFWENLKKPVFRLRAVAAALALGPWIFATYLSAAANRAWFWQVFLLALAWAWSPWVRDRWPRALGYLVAGYLLSELSPDSAKSQWAGPLALAGAFGVSLLRISALSLPMAPLRNLLLLIMTGIIFTADETAIHEREGWNLALRFAFTGLMALYWEELTVVRSLPFRGLGVFAAAALVYSVVHGDAGWLMQLCVLALSWLAVRYIRFPRWLTLEAKPVPAKSPTKGRRRAKVEEKAPAPPTRWARMAAFLGRLWLAFASAARSLAASKRARRAAAALLFLVLGGYGLRKTLPHLATTLVSITPEGEVSKPNTVIRATFSKDILAAGDLARVFVIEPPLRGETRIEENRTLVFSPAEPLRPATHYKVRLDPASLAAKHGFLKVWGTGSFHTPAFRVVSSRLFYTYDILQETEKELAGEIQFNVPVTLEDLRQRLAVHREGKALAVTLEPGSLPTRFFFKAGGLKREKEDQKISVLISKGLPCQNCQEPLENDFLDQATLPARPKMTVQAVELHHQPGSSLISILFSLPASLEQVKSHVRVEPGIPLAIETEYCYAVLKAEFEPNKDYKIIISPGLRSMAGEAVEKESVTMVRLRDVQPYVRFADRGRILPLDGRQVVGIKTMNLDEYRYSVEKIFRNNVVAFLKNRYHNQYGYYDEEGEYVNYDYESGYSSGLGATVANGSVTVQGGRINEEVESAIGLSSWQKAAWKGLFRVSLNDKAGQGRDERWFMVSNLGLVGKISGKDLLVQALSTSTSLPLAGIHLSLLSETNQVITQAVTGPEGRAWFRDFRNNPLEFQAMLVLAESGEDWSFLRVGEKVLEAARFDTGGDPAAGDAWDGYLTSDRGLYRPGDNAHFTAILRKADLSTPPDLPAHMTIWDARGEEVTRLRGSTGRGGMAVFDFHIQEALPTGTFRAGLVLEGTNTTVSEVNFKVEEFIPHKIKAEVRMAAGPAAPGEALAYDVVARHLFGAVAPGLRVGTRVSLHAEPFKPKNYSAYQFGDDSRGFPGQVLEVPDGTTDEAGIYSVRLPVPDTLLPPAMLKAVVSAEVFDTGGRPVGAYASVEVHRYPLYLGLRSRQPRHVNPGDKVTLDYVGLSPEGKEKSAGSQSFVVKRRRWYSVFRKTGWAGRGYESNSYDEVVLGREVKLKSQGTLEVSPDKPGEYTVYLGTPAGTRTAYTFVALGPGSSPDSGETGNLEAPENLTLSLDQKKYKTGDAPRLEVRAPFAGTLMVSLEREKVFWIKSLSVHAGLNALDLPPVAEELFPNAYVVALLSRPPAESQRNLPVLSFGIVPLMMNLGSREMALAWSAPAKTESRQGIPVTLTLGVPGAQVVLSAVDEGILRIVNFDTPNPFSHFYRKRGLGTVTFSHLDDVLPELSRRAAVGGGEEGLMANEARHLNPIKAKRVVSYAKFSGILTADAEGRVRYNFSTDKFQGEVRVMALAAEGKKFGGGETTVVVSDPIVVEPSFPRFMAPGDIADIPVLIYSQKKEAVELKVRITAKGPLVLDGNAEQTLKLEPRAQGVVTFHAKAKLDAGKAEMTVAVTEPSGRRYDSQTELAVRPGNPLTTEVHFGTIKAGSETSMSVPGGFIPEGQKLRLAVSSSPLMLYLRSLDYLVDYPYGCAEQLTSQSFPLLYFEGMGLLSGRFDGRRTRLQASVQDGISQLERLQNEDGGFRPWPGSARSNDYLSNYVSHFLIEAEKKGYDVNPQVMDRIRKRIGAIQIVQTGGRLDRRQANIEIPDSTYVLYLKVLAGVPDKEALRAKLGALKKDFFLSLAFSALGDRTSALQALPPWDPPNAAQRALSDDWFSPNKHRALHLLSLVRANPTDPRVQTLLIEFGKFMRDGHFGSTHDNAWAFMALAEAAKSRGTLTPLSGAYAVKGGEDKILSGETATVRDRELSGRDILVKNRGGQPLYYHLMAEGTRLKAKEENVSNGLTIRREYRDEGGQSLNLGSIEQGQMVIVTLRISCAKPLDNLVVVDLLPAGFEVDNPRLASRGQLGFDPGSNFTPAYQDFRDDRVLLFSDEVSGDLSFSYGVRAVTPGHFQVPGLLAEAMYDPDVYGRYHEAQSLVVAPSGAGQPIPAKKR